MVSCRSRPQEAHGVQALPLGPIGKLAEIRLRFANLVTAFSFLRARFGKGFSRDGVLMSLDVEVLDEQYKLGNRPHAVGMASVTLHTPPSPPWQLSV